jgi:hypothetical protein
MNGVINNNSLNRAVPPSQRNSTLNINIARQPTSSGKWNGQITDVRIYNRTLSSAEILELFNLPFVTYPQMPGITVQLPDYMGGAASVVWHAGNGKVYASTNGSYLVELDANDLTCSGRKN